MFPVLLSELISQIRHSQKEQLLPCNRTCTTKLRWRNGSNSDKQKLHAHGQQSSCHSERLQGTLYDSRYIPKTVFGVLYRNVCIRLNKIPTAELLIASLHSIAASRFTALSLMICCENLLLTFKFYRLLATEMYQMFLLMIRQPLQMIKILI